VPLNSLTVTERIVLVPRHASNAIEVFAALDAHRDDLREWLPWVDAMRSLMDVKRYAQFAERQLAQSLAYDFAIRENGRIVGGVGIHSVDSISRNAQLGYYLLPPARGRGVLHLAARALTGAAFTRLGLHRLEIRCIRENERGRAVAERLGFRFEGVLEDAELLHGAFRDVALYSMTAPRWEAEHSLPNTKI
jgi:RimJ/RimL family protein N-acetyltransferase